MNVPKKTEKMYDTKALIILKNENYLEFLSFKLEKNYNRK